MIAPRLEILVAHQHLPGLDRALAGQRLDELALPVAGDAGDADDLAGPDHQIEAGHRLAALVVLDMQAGDFQHLVVARRLYARGAGAHDGVADHHRRHFARRQLADLAAADFYAAPQHADVVAERLHFAELVGDHQRGDLAAMRHAFQQAQNLIGLAGRQHRGRLVENQEALVEIEQLEDFELLLLAGGERGDGTVERHAERHARQELFEHGAFLAPVDDLRRIGAADDQIFGGGERRHQREMLIDHADAERLSVLGIGDSYLLAIEFDLAFVGRVETHDAFDQRRLAGAVLAEQRVEGAGGHLDRDIVERLEATERLAHVKGFKRGAASGRRS